MANDYCTTTDVKDVLIDSGISSTDITSYDTILATIITRASRLIDMYTKREPGAYAVSTSSTDETTRYFTGSGGAYQYVNEMAASPSVVAMSEAGGVQSSDYTTIPSSDFFLFPDNAEQVGRPYTRIDLDTINGAYSTWYRYRRSVKVTAPWGYAYKGSTPEDVVQATIITAARWFKRGAQGFADVGAIVELGQLKYTRKLDIDVEEILAHYRRVTV